MIIKNYLKQTWFDSWKKKCEESITEIDFFSKVLVSGCVSQLIYSHLKFSQSFTALRNEQMKTTVDYASEEIYDLLALGTMDGL